jgi:plasmid replication initiation protein
MEGETTGRKKAVAIRTPKLPLFEGALDSPLTAAVKSERRFLEYPFFDLSKTARRQELVYEEEMDGRFVFVRVRGVGKQGIASIFDRDMLLYVGSLFRARIDRGEEPERTYTFTVNDFCEATGRSAGGDAYKRIRDLVDRLRSTSITTNVETEEEGGDTWFNWLDEGTSILYDKDPATKTRRIRAIRVVLGRWLYRAFLKDKDILVMSDQYFDLAPIERRIYDIAHVMCSTGKPWKTTLRELHAKVGSDMSHKRFKEHLVEVQRRGLPDYEIGILEEYAVEEKARRGRPSVAGQKIELKVRSVSIQVPRPRRRRRSAADEASVEPSLLDYIEQQVEEAAE